MKIEVLNELQTVLCLVIDGQKFSLKKMFKIMSQIAAYAHIHEGTEDFQKEIAFLKNNGYCTVTGEKICPTEKFTQLHEKMKNIPQAAENPDAEVKIPWIEVILERLRDYSEGEVWSNGHEIMCKTKEQADAMCDLLTSVYHAQGDIVTILTGFYDPETDERNNETDYCTGWWYVTLD